MTETLEKIFKLLKVPKLIGYFLILLVLILTSLGSLYINDKIQRNSHRDKLIKDREYNEQKDNEREIRKVLNEIDTELFIYLDWPFDTPGTSKVDLQELRNKLSNVIQNNTDNFSSELRSSLVQIKHILQLVILNNEALENITQEQLNENPKLIYETIEPTKNSGVMKKYPAWRSIILNELDSIEY